VIGWSGGAGTAAWVLVVLALLGGGVGALTGRTLASAGYRIESDDAGASPRHWWWPALALAALWAFLGWRIGDFVGWAALPAYLLFAWLTIALVWIDADVHRLPDGLVLPAYPAIVALLGLGSLAGGDWRPMARALIVMAVLFLLYFVLAWISPDSLGFGDVKLAGLIGLVLGWLGIFQTVVGLFAGFLVGGLIALVLLLGRRVGMRSHIAFGPSMLAGALLALALEFR
jgi:leader peptidase (prepilin peptidase) / N-methyltransferase